MGSKYHTVHHTHYHYNFGQVRSHSLEPALWPRASLSVPPPSYLLVQFFTFCDAFWGTLKVPEKSKLD
jgi:hypothetical protein